MKSRIEFLYLTVPFILWAFCFRDFFTGHVLLMQDAVSYADHIKFYTENLSKGVFPLWNPFWFNGAPYDFFLRRMGDCNPLLLLVVFLKWLGFSSANAYLCFLGMYYFLAGWAFYLIARLLFEDSFFAFTGYILFLFSSWGSEIFYNYIIIIFVPIIWFFYFLLCFSRTPQKGYLLGMCFCLGIILTTYIPFFFLTIFAVFCALAILFYPKVMLDLLKRSFVFLGKNKIFVSFCIVFLLVSCIPGLLFYKGSQSGEFVLTERHAGAAVSSAVAVALSNVESGDLINHGFSDHLFGNHQLLDMGDIFLPNLFFILLLVATMAKVNKPMLFLLSNILVLFLISITSASGLHRFLFEHLYFFKFIRNIYYFFWLAMLPMAVLLAISAFKSLLSVISQSSKKGTWLVYIILCHVLFILFLCRQQGISTGAWAAVLVSMVYFLVYFYGGNKYSRRVGFILLFLAVFVQSFQVYGFLGSRMYKIQQDSDYFAKMHPSRKVSKLATYYDTRWFDLLVNNVDPQVLENYRKHRFILYDNVFPYVEGPAFFNILGKSTASNDNIAYVARFESGPFEWRKAPYSAPQADIDPMTSGKLTLLGSDANTWKLKMHLAYSQFLVINDNYTVDWHAFINGHPAHLLRANVSFKGLWVPAGDSVVLLCYSTPMHYFFHFSLIVLFAGTFLYLLALLQRRYV